MSERTVRGVIATVREGLEYLRDWADEADYAPVQEANRYFERACDALNALAERLKARESLE